MNTRIDHDVWCSMNWEAEDMDGVEEKRYHDQSMYADTVDTIEITKPKVSLLSIDEIREEQEKDKECKTIRKAWRGRVSTQYHEDERVLVC